MRLPLLIGGIVLAGAVGASLFLRPTKSPTADGAGRSGVEAQDGGDAVRGPAGVEVPVQVPGDGASSAGARTPQEAPPLPPLEPVTPLLELAVVQANSAADASEETSQSAREELLLGRHGEKTRAQLELSYRSVRHVLDLQKDPDALPKDQVLSEQALQALEIEAGWLKERIYR